MKNPTTYTVIATHNGLFHADEIVALALLIVFKHVQLANIQLIRSRDNHKIQHADIVLDVGGVFNQSSLRFDHHQIHNGTVSTAGLVWQWLKQSHFNKTQINLHYPRLERLIKAIDLHDCGQKMMGDFAFSAIISSYNHEDVYNDTQQQQAFERALQVAITFIASIKHSQNALIKSTSTINQAKVYSLNTIHGKNGQTKVLELSNYCQNWQQIIHGNSQYADISYVIWYIPNKSQWCVQVPCTNESSFTLQHPKLSRDKQAIFIHDNGFIGFYKHKQQLLNALAFNGE